MQRMRALVALVGLVATATLLLLAGEWVIGQWATAGPANPRPPASDATPLVAQRHYQAVNATLAVGERLAGTLYPALPGANMLTLTRKAAPTERGAAARGMLRLRVTMPGMAMLPIQVTLWGQGDRYRGTLVLPMFGSYLARVVLVAGGRRWQGAMPLLVPLVVTGT
jgi:hypothetical protein